MAFESYSLKTGECKGTTWSFSNMLKNSFLFTNPDRFIVLKTDNLFFFAQIGQYVSDDNIQRLEVYKTILQADLKQMCHSDTVR